MKNKQPVGETNLKLLAHTHATAFTLQTTQLQAQLAATLSKKMVRDHDVVCTGDLLFGHGAVITKRLVQHQDISLTSVKFSVHAS